MAQSAFDAASQDPARNAGTKTLSLYQLGRFGVAIGMRWARMVTLLSHSRASRWQSASSQSIFLRASANSNEDGRFRRMAEESRSESLPSGKITA